MKRYMAIIAGGRQLSEGPLILEQDRETMGREFLNHAIRWAFELSAEDGVDAERNPYRAQFYVDGVEFTSITLNVYQHFSEVWADVILLHSGKSEVVRHMNIAS